MGYIRPHGDGAWRIDLEIGRDTRGKRLRRSEIVKGRKADALRRLRQLGRDVDTGAYIPTTARTLGDFVGEWLPVKRANLSPTTIRGYQVLLGLHILPAIGSLELQKITPAEAGAVIAALVDRGATVQAQRCHVLLSTIFAAAVRSGATGRNPMAALERPRVQRREMVTLTPAQAQAILADLAESESWALVPITLLLTSGLRRSELCGLRWADMDLDAGLLRIQRSAHVLKAEKDKHGNKLPPKVVYRQPKTARARRTVALDAHTIAMLREHRSECARSAEMFGRTLTDADPVFAPASEYGKGQKARPWRNDAYSQLWWRTAKRLGIRARLHDLRHTSASLLLAAGVNARVISARLGHSTVAFTLDTYSHLLPDADSEAAEKLAAILGNGHRSALPER